MEYSSEEKEFLKKMYDSALPKIKQSEMMLSLCTPGFERAPECIFQIGAGVLLNKPIGLLVLSGAKVPPLLEKIATAIVYADSDKIEDAGVELISKMKAALKKEGNDE